MSKETFSVPWFAIFADCSDGSFMTHDLVFNIRPASWSSIRQMNQHETNRDPDGTSAIDPARSHLNRILVGPATQGAAIKALVAEGVKRPAAQAEAPFLQIVVSASPAYFRPSDPDAKGIWDPRRLKMFEQQTMAWLQKEFGRDLIHVSFHGDEDTPHYHVLVAPTYDKKPRRPGRRKRNETEDEFEARKLAAESGETVRTIGRSSHATISQRGSYERLRRSYASRLALLDIGYGNQRAPDAPAPKTTAKWVKEEAKRLADERRQLADDREEVIQIARDEGFQEGRAAGFAAAEDELRGLRGAFERMQSCVMGIVSTLKALLPKRITNKFLQELQAVQDQISPVLDQVKEVLPTEDPVDEAPTMGL
jgi:flagellar biosynthesis/type III secretory pathway protein FliH